MTEKARPAYCRQCGGPVRENDKFCGKCGAAVLAPPPQAEQIIPRPVAVSQGPTTRRNRRSLLLASVAGALIMLLVGGGALAFLGSGLGSVPADAPPDPAFDLLLPTLEERTTAPIILPAELPDEFGYFAVDGALSGSSWGLWFGITPPDDPVGGWSGAETVGALTAIPASEPEENEYFEATSTETVQLPDGTDATLSRMEPVGEPGAYGPHWQGEFEKGGHVYSLTTTSTEIEKEAVRQFLSTMVVVP